MSIKIKDDDYLTIANALWDAGKEKEAFKYFREGAKKGDDGCQLNLGAFYSRGIGTVTDTKKAFYWWKQSFKSSGSSAAAESLAVTYLETGKYIKAVKWFVKIIEADKKEKRKLRQRSKSIALKES